MTRIVFIDTETTSLRPDRRAWEVGLIVREPGKPDAEHQWFIHTEDLDLGNADLMSLNIGRFHRRHPSPAGMAGTVQHEAYVLQRVWTLTRGAHLVGAVPNFDTEVLGARMRANGICPSWHYHLVDVEPLAASWLAAYAAQLELGGALDSRVRELRSIAAPPWNSDELSRAVGIEPDEDGRHTALGDARWARDIYDRVMDGGLL